MDPTEPTPQLHDLMAAVGFLLLRWGNIEGQLNGAAPPPQLDSVRLLRNLICHGLEAANVDPTQMSEPWLRCRDSKGQEVIVSYMDLQEAIRTLERLIGTLTGSGSGRKLDFASEGRITT
jgi:hypothetical protein